MDQKGELSFQIKSNNFNDVCSDFVYHTTLKTTAYLAHPYYAKLSVTRNSSSIKILCIRTSQSLMQVLYKNNEFQEHKKVIIDDDRLEKQHITVFTFKTDLYSASNPPSLIIGYRSGLVSYYDTINERLIRLYNYDSKTKAPHKQCSVAYLAVLPQSNNDEILVMFTDSTASRYHLTSRTQDDFFVEKIKKFHAKTSFNPATNRYNHTEKTKNNYYYRNGTNELNPEFSHFFTCALQNQGQNPKAYYKFNHRTMSDLVLKRHSSFSKTLLNDPSGQEITVLALTSLDGYLTIFELSQMIPLLSYKGYFGGINSVSFSESCELVALSGQDDCITVLDLNTFTTLRCEGHKSFVSRCIFHSIPTAAKQNGAKEQSPTHETSTQASLLNEQSSRAEEGEFVRIISCGLDSALTFWEFPKNIFGNNNWLQREEDQPISLNIKEMPPPTPIKPIHVETEQDAIGWIELCGDMLVQCLYDGAVCTNLIKDLEPGYQKDNGESRSGKSPKRNGGETARKLLTMNSVEVPK